MEWIIDSAQAHGWPAERLQPESSGTSLGTVTQGDAFEVELKSSGAVYTAPPDKSVATVLGEAGIDLPLSCGSGVCGTCVTRVPDGVLDHQDSYLTAEERARNDRFTPCCSRALSARILPDL